jgi:hypothetical protein
MQLICRKSEFIETSHPLFNNEIMLHGVEQIISRGELICLLTSKFNNNRLYLLKKIILSFYLIAILSLFKKLNKLACLNQGLYV